MYYIIYINTIFGDIRVRFDTDGMLDNDADVLNAALEELKKSNIINVEKLKEEPLFFEITEGETRFD